MNCKFTDELVVVTSASQEQFWNAIKIWNDRPNLINKHLIGNEIISKFQLTASEFVFDIINNLFLFAFEVGNLNEDKIKHCLQKCNSGQSITFSVDDNLGCCIYVKKLLRKTFHSNKRSEIEIAVLDFSSGNATFYNADCSKQKNDVACVTSNVPYTGYRLSYTSQLENIKSCITLSLLQECLVENNSLPNSAAGCLSNNVIEWLKNKLLPKIKKWSEEDDNHNKESVYKTGSLRLVDINDYCILYQKLKNVYGKKFVEIWPEATDPLKFVYEDVAIATYLLLLWRGSKQNFVDMGCGNGLLVHILTCEGHSGLGVDVRSRKIWGLYPEGTAKLEVKTISPSSDDSCLFQEADWLIGNHSDELTPWIPVIASLSSYKCNFFLLPCCSYELNGQKYQRQNSCKSQYMDYLDYVGSLCNFCGFNYEFDKLRIPSTKRICIVSNQRNYAEIEQEHKVNSVRNLINTKCSLNVKNEIDNLDKTVLFDHFKTRSKDIIARNCTQLDRNFVQDLVLLLSRKLLNSVSHDKSVTKSGWNEGSPIALNELARNIPSHYLKKLKKECGGLQTLIKNHHYIFKIDKGLVSFRKPLCLKSVVPKNNANNNNRLKTKPCWFYNNHPDKCPLADGECQYVHS